MESNIILTKGSSSEEIKNYFQAILKLSQADNEFPINLDEVWPLVYSRKDKAVRSLEENFIQGIDYQVLPQNGENLTQGGRPSNVYHLTLSCMEFFIARKVRPVFEVYRQVFHGVAQGKLPNPVKPAKADSFSVADKVEFIAICRDAGFAVWDVAALVGDLLDSAASMTELREVITQAAKLQVLEPKVLQIVVSLYARAKGLPSTHPTELKQEPEIPESLKEVKLMPSGKLKLTDVQSMAKLLCEKGYKGVYAREVMDALCQYGYVRKITYEDSTRWEWSLTIDGLSFGRNTSSRGGVAVRPKWFVGTFDIMMRALGFDKEEGKEVSL